MICFNFNKSNFKLRTNNNSGLKGFTIAETSLTMVIFGFIAVVIITALKPSQYYKQSFDTLKKKTYSEIYQATAQIRVECAKNFDVRTIYDDCDRTKSTHSFGFKDRDFGFHEANLYARYLNGTVASAAETANGNCKAKAYFTSLRLKNGVCVYFGSDSSITVDVNGEKMPNDNNDKYCLTIVKNGISEDMEKITQGNCNLVKEDAFETCPDRGAGSFDCCVKYAFYHFSYNDEVDFSTCELINVNDQGGGKTSFQVRCLYKDGVRTWTANHSWVLGDCR